MENKIPTAEELARIEYDDDRLSNIFMERQVDMKWAIFMMQKFAKLHVEQALKAAAENVELYEGMHYGTISYEVDEHSILNAYPLDLIK